MKKSSDFLVIGSGIAGLSFAINAAKTGSVIVVTKKGDNESNTNYAQGGIASVFDPHDSFALHMQDTITAGKGVCHEDAVEILVEEGPDRIKELISWGTKFTTSPSSKAFAKLDLGREGGHSVNRIAHSRDLTGKEVEKSLLNSIKKNPNITLYENHCLVELITNHHLKRKSKQNTCYGAYVLDTINREITAARAKITFLSTGGVGQVYLHTTNPEIATGDGIACAYRAGAEINNMEFIQFHPTALYHTDYHLETNAFLISEALRGYGAILKDSRGREFMNKYHKMKSLAPRDIVARAIDSEMKKTGEPCVYLDIRHALKSKTRQHFPNIYKRCKEYGIDITKHLIPVVPASHYICGGIHSDTYGRTSIDNLYAGGEAACTGVHGANRLASNSLLEALVFSKRSALHAGGRVKSLKRIPAGLILQWDDSGTIDNEEWVLVSHNLNEIKNIMWDYVGIVRSNLRLERALRRLRLLESEIENFYRRTKITPKLLELRNIVTIAKLIVICALKRHESRGLHFTTDYPEQNDRFWKRDTKIIKSI
ncbi:L-aspartate oxidase [Fibrobacterota bacterium]